MKTLLMLTLLGCAMGVQAQTPVGSAADLRAKHDALQPQLRQNAFQKPLHLASTESGNAVSGDIFAVVAAPFEQAAPALAQPESWCEILLLQFNVKLCRAAAQDAAATLEVRIARKPEQPAEQAYKVAFKLAMQMYLGTSGADKVGFSPVGGAAGKDQLVGGMRGVVERNTMRYYLAIEAFLGALGNPPPARFEKAARDWFAGTERYKRQLYEMEQGAYLAMKRREYQAQAQVQARR